jgi:hypothetical protein
MVLPRVEVLSTVWLQWVVTAWPQWAEIQWVTHWAVTIQAWLVTQWVVLQWAVSLMELWQQWMAQLLQTWLKGWMQRIPLLTLLMQLVLTRLLITRQLMMSSN